jgi:hypothetical protein
MDPGVRVAYHPISANAMWMAGRMRMIPAEPTPWADVQVQHAAGHYSRSGRQLVQRALRTPSLRWHADRMAAGGSERRMASGRAPRLVLCACRRPMLRTPIGAGCQQSRRRLCHPAPGSAVT